jgi:holo-[acyl-carrier protein] synthase
VTGSPVAAIETAWRASAGSFGATVGVGIDVVETAPLESLITAGGSAFLDAAWSRFEQRDAAGAAERLAVRWAAKEAVMKALQCGLGDLGPLDIEIRTSPDGSPSVVLHGNADAAALALGVQRWHVALCHEQGWAVAIAVADRSLTAPTGTPTIEGNRHE